MYTLSWTQAIEMMQQGKRVKHQYFTSEEFFEMKDNRILDEEGYSMDGWYRGEAWQDGCWMVIEEPSGGFSKEKVVIFCDDLSGLEDRIIARYNLEPDYCVGITIPQTQTMPREKQNFNFRITKGRGHNKLQKKGKK